MSKRRWGMRRSVVIGTLVIGGLMVAAPALAHVTVAPGEVPASGYTKLDFSVPHGCDGSATVSVAVQIPAGVVSVTPQVVPGWEITMEEGPLDEPAELHGETITEGVTSVIWSGGPLDDHHLEVFGMSVNIQGEEGETLYFPTVQTCEEGEAAWIEIPEDEEELEMPAPALTLGPSGSGHDEDEGASSGDDEASAPDGEDEEPVAAGVTGGDDPGPSAVAWVGLALAAAATAIGGTALATLRRR